MKKKIEIIISTILVITMFVPTTIVGATQQKECGRIENKEYLVMTKTQTAKEELQSNYATIHNGYTEKFEQENISLNKMAEEQAEQLQENENIICVEENINLKGSGIAINPKDVSSVWNLEMIINVWTMEKELRLQLSILE